MEEKIQKWEEEIERITKKQQEIIAKNNERIRELRKKIEEAKEVVLLENNKLIADAVREIYGDISAESIDDFKELMKLMGTGRQQSDIGSDAGILTGSRL